MMISVRVCTLFFAFLATSSSFQIPTLVKSPASISADRRSFSTTTLWDDKTDGVVELADEEEETAAAPDASSSADANKSVAPFLSQGEISEEPMDLSDPKQARVMFYIILSLLPVLFLIPLMLGSREMIPAEMLPPVDLS
mmetsp:Transcript_119016/g.333391  ORF Transcript_119016/g.333391 Transcript_119016/m.333391 type:complete len:140 (+) Transcript_119016:133-552(+)